jgi:hypothetical protein
MINAVIRTELSDVAMRAAHPDAMATARAFIEERKPSFRRVP